MEPTTKTPWQGMVAFGCALWFLLTGSFWTYGMSLFIAYPVGLAGLILWNQARKSAPQRPLVRISGALLGLGLLVSLGSIWLYR